MTDKTSKTEVLLWPTLISLKTAKWGGQRIIEGLKKSENLGRYLGKRALISLTNSEKLGEHLKTHHFEHESTNIIDEITTRFSDENLTEHNTLRLARLIKRHAVQCSQDTEPVSLSYIELTEYNLQKSRLAPQEVNTVIDQLRLNLELPLGLESPYGPNQPEIDLV